MNLQENIRRILREETEISTYVRRRLNCFDDFMNRLENNEDILPIIRRQLEWYNYQIIVTAYMRVHCGEDNSYYDPHIHSEIMKLYGNRLYDWYLKSNESILREETYYKLIRNS